MVCLDFLSDVPSLCYDLISCLWWSEPSCIMRLSDILNLPLLWGLESYYITMTDILWHDFHWMHVSLLICHPLKPYHCDCPLPHLIWNMRHAWALDLTLHIIIIVHCHAIEPITSAQWACNHDLDSTVLCAETWLLTQLLGATRYVKKFSKLLNTPKLESHNCLEEDEKVYLKTSLQSCHPWLCILTFSNLLALLG